MRVCEMDWRMVEDWVRHDDRAVLPLGSTEQHAGLSLMTDAILAERVKQEIVLAVKESRDKQTAQPADLAFRRNLEQGRLERHGRLARRVDGDG